MFLVEEHPLFPVQTLLPIEPLAVEGVQIDADRLTSSAASTAAVAACPLGGVTSHRVQSRYVRTVADLAWADRSLTLRLRVRRLVCSNPACVH